MIVLRQRGFLWQRYRAILAYTGLIAVILGGLVLAPLIVLLAWPGEIHKAFSLLGPGVGLVLGGGGLWLAFRPRAAVTLTFLEGTVLVVLAWLLAMVVGALPFMLSDRLNFTQAVFEATSGWTTTGLSVVDVTKASPLILLYRSTLQLAGGAGLAILMLSAFGGPTGVGLSSAEGREKQLVPHVRRSAKLVLTIYAGYVLAGCLSLRLAGMNWFDAVNHSFAAVSTGGFSTQADSIGHWNSPLVEAVTIPLMILGNLNFLTSYALLKGRFGAVWKNGEVRLMAFLLPLAGTALLLGATAAVYPSLTKAVRVAVFEAVTALTTTGFSTVDYAKWNALAIAVFVPLMLIGGGICSTAGGIKQYRIHLLYRALIWELRRMLRPQSAVGEPEIWQGEQSEYLNDRTFRLTALFAFSYLAFYFVGVAVLAAHGYGLSDSLFEFASALGTVGLSVGLTTPQTPPVVLWLETLAMFLGRLEIFGVILGLAKLLKDARTLVLPGKAG